MSLTWTRSAKVRQEDNQIIGQGGIFRGKRISTNFQDKPLSDIFAFATKALDNCAVAGSETLTARCLELVLSCLEFTFPNRNEECAQGVQLPDSWKSLILNEQLYRPVFRLLLSPTTGEALKIPVSFVTSSPCQMMG